MYLFIYLFIYSVILSQHYKPEGGWFDSRWCHWNFSLA